MVALRHKLRRGDMLDDRTGLSCRSAVLAKCGKTRELEEPIDFSLRLNWHELTKAGGYCLSLDAMTRVM